MTSTRFLAAGDILSRGVAIVRANWRLALYRWAFALVPALLVLFALALPILATGSQLLADWPQDPSAWEGRVRELVDGMTADPGTLLLALAGSFLLVCLSLMLWAFVESGTFGILHASDRQAPAGAKNGDWFRTLSLGDFFGWGRRYMWRYLGLLIAFVALLAALYLLMGGLVALAIYCGRQWGAVAGFGIGCGGALPLGFLLAASGVAYWLAAADLVRDQSGALIAFSQAFRILGRRIGAVLLLLLVWVGALIALSMLFLIPSLLLQAMFGDSLQGLLAVDVVLQLVQSLFAQFLHLWFAASVVVLVRSEGVSVRAERFPGEPAS